VFVWIAVGLLSLLALGGAAIAALVIPSIETINTSGGWGWLLIGGVYVVVATIVCLVAAICSAVSLMKRERHTRLATVILLACTLEVWLFRGSFTVITRGFGPDENIPIVRAEAQLSSALVRQFAGSNIALRPGDRAGGFQTGWFLDDPDVGSQCEVSVHFRHFPSGTPVETMRTVIEATSPRPVLNEQASLIMFLPNAGIRTSGTDCDAWSAKSAEVTARIVSAFQSFSPSASFP
jgi:hypothetical protein